MTFTRIPGSNFRSEDANLHSDRGIDSANARLPLAKLEHKGFCTGVVHT